MVRTTQARNQGILVASPQKLADVERIGPRVPEEGFLGVQLTLENLPVALIEGDPRRRTIGPQVRLKSFPALIGIEPWPAAPAGAGRLGDALDHLRPSEANRIRSGYCFFITASEVVERKLPARQPAHSDRSPASPAAAAVPRSRLRNPDARLVSIRGLGPRCLAPGLEGVLFLRASFPGFADPTTASRPPRPRRLRARRCPRSAV